MIAMGDPLLNLILMSKGPFGPSRAVDFGTISGPLGELSAMLLQRNGFALFNAGVQVFRGDPGGIGPELAQWNSPHVWKDSYGALADDLFCFGQDLFGVQFAISDNRTVVTFDPENGHRASIGSSLQDWAEWLLADPNVRGAHGFATSWQDEHGALTVEQRLIPRRFFVLGGTYDRSNVTSMDAVEAMRIRGPLARHLHNLPKGANVQLGGEQKPTRADLQLVADYGQIHLFDQADATVDVSEEWTDQLLDLRIGSDPEGPTLIGLGVARNAKVSFALELLTQAPDQQVQPGWDHVVEASINAPSEVLVLSGPTAAKHKAVEIHVAPGVYRVRHHMAGLDTISDDALDGDDHYELLLWPESYREPEVLKGYSI
ncbi:hypothetical protein OOZ19_04095 [Saccharopolyspora sp. NFXS83]|uniref:hypothetical protein n=1 Tax=Saccharopolyspora sp. NFXS83 TaxID=2993560 RepID=UPI00224B872B|nr:hypothetical protein [Saccharopolyspora sp. NFXS83]MCX2729410.1 hypothetical protein [Saccharopolyspora sp. NFXS83]